MQEKTGSENHSKFLSYLLHMQWRVAITDWYILVSSLYYRLWRKFAFKICDVLSFTIFVFTYTLGFYRLYSLYDYRKLVRVGFKPKTTEFRSDVLTDGVITPWVQLARALVHTHTHTHRHTYIFIYIYIYLYIYIYIYIIYNMQYIYIRLILKVETPKL